MAGLGDRWLMWTHDGSVINVEESSTVVFSTNFLRSICRWQSRRMAGEFSSAITPLWEVLGDPETTDMTGTLVVCNEPRRVVWRLTGEMDRGGYVGVWPD